MIKNQLSLFSIKKESDESLSEKKDEVSSDSFCDIMSNLDYLIKRAEDDNLLIQSMIDDIQKDWTEEEKMKINNPKEYSRLEKLKNQNLPMAALTTEAIEVLKESKIEGLIVKLPEGELDRKVYLEVAGRLDLIGGKWKGGKIKGFVFQQDPTELLEDICNGEKRNLKKEYQFFATPDDLADELVELASIDSSIYDPEQLILEPSAGQGAIIKAIKKVMNVNQQIHYFELIDLNDKILRQNFKDCTICLGKNFLDTNLYMFDKIIANPPFSKNQDIDHIRKMYSCLKSGGRLVSVASKHWIHSSNKKEKEFKDWLDYLGAKIIEIEAGRFKESGTMISSVIIIINKD